MIDFHTHIFPDAVAPKALASLQAGTLRVEGRAVPPRTDGTMTGLVVSMTENAVEKSVVLPIATKPSQTPSINRFASGIQSDRLLSFYSLHPQQEDWAAVLDEIAAVGGKGIKLHPEFQFADVDSPEMIRILHKAAALHLIVVLHAGKDIGMPPPVHCTPMQLARALDAVPDACVVAAHMGGWRMWDEVEQYLVGRGMYFDTAFVADYIAPEQYLRMIRNHGADRILFGSDSPWETPQHTLAGLQALGLTAEELEKITHQNADRLLGQYTG
ncbi:MAG: amidohydrolase [Clostridiales bacterium]|nr:amidohydrolase [Clostridiales bacterium]